VIAGRRMTVVLRFGGLAEIESNRRVTISLSPLIRVRYCFTRIAVGT